jgi:hypothetical protein
VDLELKLFFKDQNKFTMYEIHFDNAMGEKKTHEETEGKWKVQEEKVILEPLRKKKTEKASWQSFTLDTPWEIEYKEDGLFNGNIKYEKKV